MKKYFLYKTVFFFLAAFSFLVVQAQEEVKGMKQKLEMNLDELGNASVAVTMKLNASQWDGFRRTIGNNPSYLKREMIKSMPKYYLSDFKYEEDQMERSYTFSMKALAVAKMDKNGKWKAELESKDPDIMKVNDRQYRLNANYLTNGVLIEQSTLVSLPSGASSAKVEKDSFGKAILTYKTGSGMMSWIIKIIGGILILAGGALLFMNKNKAVPVATGNGSK